MAATAGKGGKVMIGANTVASVKSWSLDASADTLNTESLGDSWKSVIIGLKEWSATVELDWDMSDAQQTAIQNAYLNGTSVSIKLYTNTTNYYSGTAFLSSLSVETPVDDIVSASAELTGSGALSYT